jgi:hypothetical protein
VPASTLNGQGLSWAQGVIVIDGTFASTTVSGGISSASVACNGLALSLTGNDTATL